MNAQLKTILLTILTLSCLTIAIVELTGISRTALFNKFGLKDGQNSNIPTLPMEISYEHEDSIRSLPKTTYEFDQRRHDFGTVIEGETVAHTYKIKNTGKSPLILADVIPTCGCTVPDFSKKPIPPGEEGEIQIAFHSANQKGTVHKTIIVVTNGEEEKATISFDAQVVKK